MQNNFVHSLRETVNQHWAQIKTGRFWHHVMNNKVSRDFYHDLMVEVHHYTKHNSMNQAVAAFVSAPEGLLKFAYHHAAEEIGHERMVVHDLESVGLLNRDALARAPLPATEALIGYLYFVALKYGPVARLGYSFWAESVYEHIGEPLAKVKSDLSLADKNMSFFVAHAVIDKKHSAQVEDCLERYAQTPADQALVRSTAETTLFLTGQMLEQVALRHA
ncbi:iron-containing redox enzyme family protein [Paraburkholderia sp. RL18-103-BIB-C]|jgi:thiaminase|uniref:iron-containing redox enzyme family protein n=1 Tax=unclassified Paraburkholderia TaxID=2615204 RepID=UPI0038B9B9F2